MSKIRFDRHYYSDKRGALSYKTANQYRHEYETKGASIYPKTKHYSDKTGQTTTVRFGGGQDAKINNPRGAEKGQPYYKADPFFKGKSRHHLDLRKKALKKHK